MATQLQRLLEEAAGQRTRADVQQERIDLAARELTEVSDRLQAAANALREAVTLPVLTSPCRRRIGRTPRASETDHQTGRWGRPTA